MRRIVGIIILCFFFMLGLVTFVLPDQSFSETENRYLQTMPEIKWAKLLDGSFMNEFEDYLADQMAGKDLFLTLKSKAEQAWLKRENNGIVKAEPFLIEKFSFNQQNVFKNIDALNAFSQAIPNMTVMVVPNQVGVYDSYLPQHLPTDNQFDVIQSLEQALMMPVINVSNTLKQHKDEDIYYHTDHHWTMRGAYYAYQTWFDEMAKPLESYERKIVSGNFQGTRYRKFHDLTRETDVIEWFDVTRQLDLTITYSDNRVSNEYFKHDLLKQTDQYRFFLDGNDPLIKIDIHHKNEKAKKLVVVKDSYADSFVPFLLSHYDEIHLIDPRYNKQSLKAYMTDHNLDELLVLYNLHTFNSDQSLRQILY